MKGEERDCTASASTVGSSLRVNVPLRAGRAIPPVDHSAGAWDSISISIKGILPRGRNGASSESSSSYNSDDHVPSQAISPWEGNSKSTRARFQRNMYGERIATTKLSSPKMLRDSSRLTKAAIVVLARNQDVDGVLLSMHRMEQRFNKEFNYPYVFLNNDDFDGVFKNRTSSATKGRTLYGKISPSQWSYPEWVKPEAAAAARKRMKDTGVLYGARESYHHMCRYYSGFFHLHPLLKEFDYYWRMEPDVHYYCDLDYDPFRFMQENKMKYGFVITILELPKTIPSLWQHTQQFMKENPTLIPKDNLLQFVTAQDGSYNLCHFWSNFEIGDLNFLRSKAYQKYFEHLDKAGGFYFERWGDAPVHSLAVAMFLRKSEVHFFQDIGYRHNSMKHCPATERNNCDCDAMEAVRFHFPSYGICHERWDKLPEQAKIQDRKAPAWSL